MLVVVGTVVAIINVLSAPTQNVSASFTVSYAANNVKATVYVDSKTQSENDSAYAGASHAFSATNATVTQTLSGNTETLGGYVTVGNTEVFQRYAVYRFTFTNNNPTPANGGKGLDVSATFTRGTMSNVVLLWIVPSTNPGQTPTVTSTFSESGNTSWPGGPYSVTKTPDNNGNFTVASNVAGGSSAYLYLFVAIDDVTIPINFTLGSGSTLIFTLTSHVDA